MSKVEKIVVTIGTHVIAVFLTLFVFIVYLTDTNLFNVQGPYVDVKLYRLHMPGTVSVSYFNGVTMFNLPGGVLCIREESNSLTPSMDFNCEITKAAETITGK